MSFAHPADSTNRRHLAEFEIKPEIELRGVEVPRNGTSDVTS